MDHTFRRIPIILLGIVILTLCISSQVFALSLAMSLEELTAGASHIVVGTVVKLSSSWNADRTHITTQATITVEQQLKGEAVSEVTVEVPGGEVDGIREWVEDSPSFSLREKAVLFLKDSSTPGRLQVFGQSQGKFEILNDQVGPFTLTEFTSDIRSIVSGNQSRLSKPLSSGTGATDPSITNIIPDSASAGTNSQIWIVGNNFGMVPGTVWFTYGWAQWVPYIMSAQVTSWSDTQITAVVPTATIDGYPYSACSGWVMVKTSTGVQSTRRGFSVDFGYGGAKWPGLNPAVSYKVNAAPDRVLAVQNAAASWSNVSGKSFAFTYGGTTTAQSSTQNNINEIIWRDLGSTTIVAQSRSWTSGNTVLEADIEFNTRFQWNTSSTPLPSTIDVETVALHELGHWLKLRDLYGNIPNYPQDSYKAMYGYINYTLIKRSLTEPDKSGIRWIYPGATTPPAVSTAAATNVSYFSATLNGNLVSMGSAASNQVFFEYSSPFYYGRFSTPLTMTTTGAFSIDVSGLESNVTYNFRALVDGGAHGSAAGSNFEFTTSASNAPVVVTEAASSVTGYGAQLNGNLTSLGTASTVQVAFEYGTQTTYGSVSTPQTRTTTGTFSTSLTTLNPGTTYNYRAKADGGPHGLVYGSNVQFTTGTAIPPAVVTNAASNITAHGAQLNGNLTSLGSALRVICQFQYGKTPDPYLYCGFSELAAPGSFYSLLTELSPGNTYYYRAVANGGLHGVSYGSTMLFTTATVPPTILTHDAGDVLVTSATLNGWISSLGSTVTISVWFEWGTTIPNYGNATPAEVKTSTGSFNARITGLNPSTSYHYRARADNGSQGTATGENQSFTTLAMPTLFITSPIGGEIWQIGTNRDITWTASWPDGHILGNIKIELTRNNGGTWETLFVDTPNDGTQAWTVTGEATNQAKVRVSSVREPSVHDESDSVFGISYTIQSPTVQTNPASNINVTTATLNGNLAALGTAPSVNVNFEYGTTISYGTMTAAQAKTATGIFSANITGLLPGMSYKFRAKADGGIHGTALGANSTFTSLPPPFLMKWGAYGDADGQFSIPYGIALDASGNIYVVDTNNHRIQKFSSNGAFITKWGSLGQGDGQFHTPRGIAIDAVGNVYVASLYSNFIQKFTSNGVFIAKWSTQGSGDGQVLYPGGVAVDVNGNVYIADTGNHRIQKFSSNGTFIAKWGIQGSDDGQFRNPYGVAVDATGNIYITDTGNHRIQKFSSNGNFQAKWGTQGSGDGQFFYLGGVAINSAGNIYVTDINNSRIQVFGYPVPPSVITGNATNIGTSSATLNGNLISPGTAASVSVSFEYGTAATAYGNATTPQARTTSGDFSANVTGLTESTTYHFRAKADGGVHGRADGSDATFTTDSTAASVQVNNGTTINLQPGDSVSNIPITIKNIPNLGSGNGVGTFTFRLNWNKDVITVSSVTPASISGWNILGGTIDSSNGQVTISGYGTNYFTVNTVIGTISITAVGAKGTSTSLELSIQSLGDKDGMAIPVTAVNAPVSIVNIVAETALSTDVESSGLAVVNVKINRGKNSGDGSTIEIPGGIGSFSATASSAQAATGRTSGFAGMEFVGVVESAPYLNPTFNATTGVFGVSSVTSPEQPNNSTVVKLLIKLTGDKDAAYTLNVSFQSITAASGGQNVPEDSAKSLTFRRGDASNNGTVDIFDAMYIAQYIVGVRPASQISAVNAACVKHDTGGDKLDIFDAMYIAQMVVGVRNSGFE
ncbi:MAG: hypothetical protein AB1597_03145 [Chloroflexota bacterium]